MTAVLAPLVAAVVLAALAALLALQRHGQRSLVGRVVGADERPVGVPTVLFFTGAACGVCHTAQRPALEALVASLGSRIGVREIDVAERPELARAYRVLTLPTTVVLDTAGAVTAVNTGFAPAEMLRGQLEALGVAAAA